MKSNLLNIAGVKILSRECQTMIKGQAGIGLSLCACSCSEALRGHIIAVNLFLVHKCILVKKFINSSKIFQ